MSKPSWIKEGAEVVVEEGYYGYAVTGRIVPSGDSNFPDCTDGTSDDAYVNSVDHGCEWISWDYLSLAKKAEPVKLPNKTERKKIAADLKKTFESLCKQVEEAQGKGLSVGIYIQDEEWDEKCLEVSYQPPQPPKEVY